MRERLDFLYVAAELVADAILVWFWVKSCAPSSLQAFA